MAATYRAIASTTYAVRTNTTINKPTGTVEGDTMVAYIVCEVIPTGPSGWERLGDPVRVQDTGGFVIWATAWQRRAGASEGASYTWTHASAASDGHIVTVQGSTGVVAHGPLTSGTGTTSQADAVTPYENASLIIFFSQNWDLWGGASPPTGTTPTFTERSDSSSNLIYVATGELATAASTGNKTQSNLNGSGTYPWTAMMVAVGGTAPTAAITGTATATIDEADIVAGGNTIIETLSNGTWVPDSTPSPAYVAGTGVGTAAGQTLGLPGRTNNGDISVGLPAGWRPGQFALMAVYNDQGDASTPTGWSEITGSPFGAGTEKLCVFSKRLAEDETNPVVTTISGSAASASHAAGIAVYDGIDYASPLAQNATSSNGTGSPVTISCPSLTSGNIAVAIVGRGDNETFATARFGADGGTIRVHMGTDEGNDAELVIFDRTVTSTGDPGDATINTSATDPYVGCVIELAAATTTPFDDKVADLIAGLDSAQAEATGWDAVVKAGLSGSNVARTSDTVATVTLPAFASYNITAQETITVTVPATMHSSRNAITGSPTFTVDTAAGGASVTPTTASLTLTGYAPTVTASDHQSVTPTTASLTLTGNAPTVSTPRLVTPTTASLTLATFAPTVTATANQLVTPTTASLALSTYAPTVSAPRTVTPSTGSLTLTTYAPTVQVDTAVTPSTASLTLTGYAPSIATPVSVTPATASLTLTGYAPTVTGGAGLTVTPSTASLTLTGFAPTVSTPRLVTPTTASLTLSTFAPTITGGAGLTLTPGAASLTLTGFAPIVSTPRLVTPITATLSLATFAPTVATPRLVTPSTASLALTGNAPTVTATAHVLLSPTTLALLITLFAPTVTSSSDAQIRPMLGYGRYTALDIGQGRYVTTVLARGRHTARFDGQGRLEI